jgi:Phage integrase, N-terminal SAM-like domain
MDGTQPQFRFRPFCRSHGASSRANPLSGAHFGSDFWAMRWRDGRPKFVGMANESKRGKTGEGDGGRRVSAMGHHDTGKSQRQTRRRAVPVASPTLGPAAIPVSDPASALAPPPGLKLIDQLRHALRVRHYAIRTEQAYVDWARRFIHFHGKQHPMHLGPTEVEAFLTHLAVARSVASTTQNQAKSALLFLYREVLGL